MIKSAFSLYAFSIYMFALGTLLVAVPNLLLAIFNVPESHEVWIRIVGMLILIIGYFDFMAARHELLVFIRWTVLPRLAVPVFLIAFVILDSAPTILILFGAIDAAAAFWTAIRLRNESATRQFLVD